MSRLGLLTGNLSIARLFEAEKIIWWIVGLAVFLRLFQLGHEGVWIDEQYSLEDAINYGGLGIRPLYYLLLKFWLIFNGSNIWARSLSVLLDVGAIFLAYKLCKFTLGGTCALITATLMTLSPLMINHAQEIRLYPLITFLTVGGSLALAHALENPTKKLLSLWAIARLGSLLTSPLMLVMFLPDCLLYGAVHWQKWRQLRAFLYGLIFVGVAWSPLFLNRLLKSTEQFVGDHSQWVIEDSVGLKSVLSRLGYFTIFTHLDLLELLPSRIPQLYYIFMTLLLWGILVIAFLPLDFSPRNRRLWIIVWAFVPFLAQLTAATLVLSGTIWKPRYLLYLAPYFIMLLAYGFTQIYRRQRKLGLLLAALYFVAVGGVLVHYYTVDYRPPWNDITESIEDQEQPGDVIVNYTWQGNYNIPRYYDGKSNLMTIHIPRGTSSKDRLQLVEDKIDEFPRADRLWLVCQSPCKNQEGFNLILDAVLGDDPTTISQQDFSNIVDTRGGQGSIELLLLKSTQNP